MKILFLGETYRADAQTWIKGIEIQSRSPITTLEVAPSKKRWKRVLSLFLFWMDIVKINRTQWDLVLAERSTSYGFFSLFIRAKVRAVAQQGITDAYPTTGFSAWIKKNLMRMVYTRVEVIHAWGHVMVPAMLHAGASPSRIMVLPKGINLELYKYNKVPQGTKKIGIVTRSLYPEYRHQDILLAAKIVAQSTLDFEIWIVGDGVLLEDLKQKVQEYGISNQIRFWGRISNDQLPSLLSKSDFYLSVPVSEGVSASLFEAMATLNFPIVSDLPAYQAFIKHGKNGLITPVAKAEDLAKYILTYIQNPESFREAVLENRRYIEENVAFDRNMKVIYDRYSSLLKQKL